MSRIRSKNTEAERTVFAHLRRKGVSFQKHYKRAAGCPDVALPKKKRAVFVDGDFWHGRDFARVKMGRKDGDYWVQKIKANMARDKKQRAALKRAGWSIIRAWASEIKRKSTRQKQLSKIEDFLNS